MFGTVSYVPAKEAIHGVTDMMRAELLEEGEVTEEIAALAVLLERGGCLKPYFSQHEQKEMRARLKEMLNAPNGKLVKKYGRLCGEYDCNRNSAGHGTCS